MWLVVFNIEDEGYGRYNRGKTDTEPTKLKIEVGRPRGHVAKVLGGEANVRVSRRVVRQANTSPRRHNALVIEVEDRKDVRVRADGGKDAKVYLLNHKGSSDAIHRRTKEAVAYVCTLLKECVGGRSKSSDTTDDELREGEVLLNPCDRRDDARVEYLSTSRRGRRDGR